MWNFVYIFCLAFISNKNNYNNYNNKTDHFWDALNFCFKSGLSAKL